MAKKDHISETPATQFLRKQGVAFSEHAYDYEVHGGTAISARELGVGMRYALVAMVWTMAEGLYRQTWDEVLRCP